MPISIGNTCQRQLLIFWLSNLNFVFSTRQDGSGANHGQIEEYDMFGCFCNFASNHGLFLWLCTHYHLSINNSKGRTPMCEFKRHGVWILFCALNNTIWQIFRFTVHNRNYAYTVGLGWGIFFYSEVNWNVHPCNRIFLQCWKMIFRFNILICNITRGVMGCFRISS